MSRLRERVGASEGRLGLASLRIRFGFGEQNKEPTPRTERSGKLSIKSSGMRAVDDLDSKRGLVQTEPNPQDMLPHPVVILPIASWTASEWKDHPFSVAHRRSEDLDCFCGTLRSSFTPLAALFASQA